MFLGWNLLASMLFSPAPIAAFPNNDSKYSLLNSVHFLPGENIFCAAYTHNNRISFYKIDEIGSLKTLQTLKNPQARLSEPQHAAFSPDGKKLVVANWKNQTLNVYFRLRHSCFSLTPAKISPTPESLQDCKPHGVAFSPSGSHLAIAYGAADYRGRAIALFRDQEDSFECVNYLKNEDLHGIPKGITFSPDGTHLLVTFSEPPSLYIFSIADEKISFRQAIEGSETMLSRPEDVKISPDGTYCAVTNSDQDRVTFYSFDPLSNTISQKVPFWTLQNPEANLHFPHSLAFSSDGKYLVVTQFGSIQVVETGDILWSKNLDPKEGMIQIYQKL